jgi:hypothetical protein
MLLFYVNEQKLRTHLLYVNSDYNVTQMRSGIVQLIIENYNQN